MKYIVSVILLGFMGYGLSIFLYIRAQRGLGAAKTSAYYALAPFLGSFLAFVVNGEKLKAQYFVGLALMLVSTAFVVHDTITIAHNHSHTHTLVHKHNVLIHSHVYSHKHKHIHFANEEKHNHKHDGYIYSQEHIISHVKGEWIEK